MHKSQRDSRALNPSLTSNLQHQNLIDSVHPCLMLVHQHSAFMLLRCQIPDTLSGLISIRKPQQTLDGHGDETGERKDGGKKEGVRGEERKKCCWEISASAEVVNQPFSSFNVYLKSSSKGHTGSTCWDEKRNGFENGMWGPVRSHKDPLVYQRTVFTFAKKKKKKSKMCSRVENKARSKIPIHLDKFRKQFG